MTPQARNTIGSVGVGDSFGLVRWNGPKGGDGVQLNIVGAIFAQFDLGAPSTDLINSDYIIGVPLTFSEKRFLDPSQGLPSKLAHLGDEFLLRGEDLERENLSVRIVRVPGVAGGGRAARLWRW